jgi:Rab3 GTPase-activating protein catalytic subunit
MSSFKAANPDCVLEDFVRWYSPRDWTETTEEITFDDDADRSKQEIAIKKYGLSNRMKIPGNIWIETWNSAISAPVRRQKRLFDDTKEAENVFEWLNSLKIGQIIENTLPVLFYSAIYECYEKATTLDLNQLLDPVFENLIEKAIKITRNNEANKYSDLISFVTSIEQMTSLKESLDSKFMKVCTSKAETEEMNEFVKRILKPLGSFSEVCHVKIENGAHSLIGKLVAKMWQQKKTKSDKAKEDSSQKNCAEKPYKREYILRSSVSRPAPYSRQSPQRMYVLLSKEEFRLAGAFTEDTMFF